MIKLIITDDHKLVRDGLKVLLAESQGDIQIVGEAASGKELIKMLPDSDAEIVLMDIDMPEMNGLEATGYIKEHFPHINVLILSMMDQEKYVAEAMKAGALGYILKTTDQKELIHAVSAVAGGEQYVSTQITLNLLKNVRPAQANTNTTSSAPAETTCVLSKRELEVLQLIAQGHTNQQIGDMLFTSKRTVETHRQSLLEKTGSKNTASLIMYASKHQLLDEDKGYVAGA